MKIPSYAIEDAFIALRRRLHRLTKTSSSPDEGIFIKHYGMNPDEFRKSLQKGIKTASLQTLDNKTFMTIA